MELVAKVASVAVPLAAFVAGLGMIAYGAYEVYAPAGWIVGGLLLAACALRYARSEQEYEV